MLSAIALQHLQSMDFTFVHSKLTPIAMTQSLDCKCNPKISGNDTKLEECMERYLGTVFCIWCLS